MLRPDEDVRGPGCVKSQLGRWGSVVEGMRALALSIVILGVGSASAGAATFGAPATVGSVPTLSTAAVAGGGGTFAFVAGQQDAIVGAVRRGAGGAWVTRTLQTGADYVLRDPQVVIDPGGTVTAVWTAELPHPALVAATAVAGAGFGAGHVIARLNDASGASPRMIVLPSGRVLVAFEDRSRLASGQVSSYDRLETLVLDRGRASALRDIGIVGAFPAIAPAGGGAIISYVAGAPRCKDSVCARRPVGATLLDSGGARSGPIVTVAQDLVTYYGPPRVTSTGSLAVVSWVRPGAGSGSPPRPFTREYSTSRSLHALTAARPFPALGGPGAGTPSIAILRNRDLLGGSVGSPPPGGPFGGQAELTLAADQGAWQTPSVLSAPSGWTTVPQVRAEATGGALAVYAAARTVPGPATYDVVAVDRSPTGALTQTTIGASLDTDDASGISSSVAADDQAIVTWPDANGGVDVALST
jgi:hypothetical protein